MELSDLVPAGIPSRLARLSSLRRRVGRALSEGPLLFLAVVLGIALLFRVAIAWARG